MAYCGGLVCVVSTNNPFGGMECMKYYDWEAGKGVCVPYDSVRSCVTAALASLLSSQCMSALALSLSN